MPFRWCISSSTTFGTANSCFSQQLARIRIPLGLANSAPPQTSQLLLSSLAQRLHSNCVAGPKPSSLGTSMTSWPGLAAWRGKDLDEGRSWGVRGPDAKVLQLR